MEIFLIRHFESEKNLKNLLSSGEDSEPLTNTGIGECNLFSIGLKSYFNKKNLVASSIHCSDSTRAIETSAIISKKFNDIPINSYKSLKSTDAGKLKGTSISDIKHVDDTFGKNLYLYRKGLYNSYNFDQYQNDVSREKKSDFEKRVINCFLEVISKQNDNVILVAHRSALIAILIYISRKMDNYPIKFYGYIDLDLGKLSHIKYNSGIWSVSAVNESISYLLDG